MLNDYKRNKAYKDAIRRAVHKGYTSVLDIGAGTGILRYLTHIVTLRKHVHAINREYFLL